MRTPKYLVDSDPLLTNVPQIEAVMEVTNEEWTAEELENAERQVEQVLMEEAFIEACFEEMLQEEESQWCHYTVMSLPTVQYTTYMPSLQYTTHTPTVQYPTHMPSGQEFDTVNSLSGTMAFYNCIEQYTFEQPRYYWTSKLNPEAPEFIPRGLAS